MFAEKGRLNVLLDAITDKKAKYSAGVPDSLINLGRYYSGKISEDHVNIELENEKSKQSDNAKIKYWENEIFDLGQKEAAVTKRLEKEYGRYFNIKYSDIVSSVADVKKNLHINDAVVEYFLTERFLCAFVITPDSFYIKKIPADSSFGRKISEFTKLLGKGIALAQNENRKMFIELGCQLYDLLISPVSEVLRGCSNLIIVPNGPLCYLPFETLIERSSAERFENQKYLLTRYNILYNYSTRLFRANSKNCKKYDYAFIGFAPTSVIMNGNRMITENLAYAEPEVKAISGLYKKHHLPALAFYSNYAKQDTFCNVMSRCSSEIIHIATHSLLNTKTPSLSGLLFSPASDSASDAILQTGKIANMKINANLAVLSACESGIGKFARGEGVIALTRSFVYAGVNNVLFSLWMVSDKYSKELMTDFYDNILDGKNYSEALRRAKLNMLKNEVSALPSNWGPFILLEN
jgi:CHAT domain-containing protein